MIPRLLLPNLPYIRNHSVIPSFFRGLPASFSRLLQQPRQTIRKGHDLSRRKRKLLLEHLEDRLVPSAVWTDKPDYAAGETAIISGSGYLPGETIQLQVVRTDGLPDYPQGNQPWQVTDGGAGDLDGAINGNFQTTWFVEEQYAGASLMASATGLTSGATASAAFTDAGTSVNITSPTATAPVTLKTLPSTVRVGFTYSTSSENGTTNAIATVKSAGGAVIVSSSKALPNTAGGQTGTNFVDVTIPAGTA